MQIEIHELSERDAYATVGSVVLRIIDGADTDAEAVDRITIWIERVLERSPFVGVWIVIHHDSPLPNGVAGRYAAREFSRHKDRQSLVYTMLGLGFWAGAASRATAMINALIGANSHVERSVEAGARRLAQELVGVNSDALVASYEALRAKMLAARAGEVAEVSVELVPGKAEASPSPSASTSRVGERSMIRRFRIVVDRELCHGHGMCAAEAPELFRVVDDKVQIDDPEPDPRLWFKAEAAARYCPQFALTIDEIDEA